MAFLVDFLWIFVQVAALTTTHNLDRDDICVFNKKIARSYEMFLLLSYSSQLDWLTTACFHLPRLSFLALCVTEDSPILKEEPVWMRFID